MPMKNLRSLGLKNYNLHIAVIGDVHTGHSKTPTTHILRNLRRTFPNNPKTGEIDLFIIEGDFFDRLLSLNDPNVKEIKIWISQFLRMCKERDIMVRVLEGTPSHDWGQPEVFRTINEELGQIGCDLKYIDELSIEHIDKFDIDILYIPDEWRVRSDDTWAEVLQLLASRNLKKVDFAVMHGMFPHQMPKNIHHQLDLHDPTRYLSIVEKYIFIGHVHFHSIWDRIIAAGSFDRIAHGEENPKGHIRVFLRAGHEDIIEFIPNKNATKYVTIDCCGVGVDDLHPTIESVINTLPDESHVRLKARKGDVAMSAKDLLQERYPQFHWTVKESGDNMDKTMPVLVDTRKLHKTINITKNNIVSLIRERILLKHPRLDIIRVEAVMTEVANG